MVISTRAKAIIIALICFILLGGVLVTGATKGWFTPNKYHNEHVAARIQVKQCSCYLYIFFICNFLSFINKNQQIWAQLFNNLIFYVSSNLSCTFIFIILLLKTCCTSGISFYKINTDKILLPTKNRTYRQRYKVKKELF